MSLGDAVDSVKGFISFVLCISIFGHDWRPYEHWEFEVIDGGYACQRCKRGCAWFELSRLDRQIANEKAMS